MINKQLKETFIKELLRIKQLETDDMFHYQLTNENSARSVFISTKIEPSDFDVLLAYIQFSAWEKDLFYRFTTEDIASVLQEHYGVAIHQDAMDVDDTDFEFNLDEVFHEWSEYASSIEQISAFKRKDLAKTIEEHVSRNKVKDVM